MGFALLDGPDVEDEWHCFDALNTRLITRPQWAGSLLLPDGRLLRRTSTVQIRTMESARRRDSA
jgi:phenylalanyl-tRNA synthetase alpha chain